jgi:hypothetical protein
MYVFDMRKDHRATFKFKTIQGKGLPEDENIRKWFALVRALFPGVMTCDDNTFARSPMACNYSPDSWPILSIEQISSFNMTNQPDCKNVGAVQTQITLPHHF